MAQIKDLKRMCDFHIDCSECELCVDDRCTVYDLPDNIDEIVDKWAEEHPAKLMQWTSLRSFQMRQRQTTVYPCVVGHIFTEMKLNAMVGAKNAGIRR